MSWTLRQLESSRRHLVSWFSDVAEVGAVKRAGSEPKASIAFLGDAVAEQSACGRALDWVERVGDDALFFDEPADEAARLGWSEAHPAQTLQV
jgi:hypothetical protein